MTTRRRSNSRRLLCGALCALGALASVRHAPAQTAGAEEAALRQRYGVASWSSGPTHPGVSVDRIAVRGLLLRARTDHLVTDGGISLSFGTSVTTLRVRVAVGSTVGEGREALLGYLRSAEVDLVPLSDPRRADVALGDTTRGDEAVAMLYGNVAISIQRTREAGAETPPAGGVLAALLPFLAPVGPPAAPVLTLQTHDGRVELRGTTFSHVEATAQGGHLRGRPSPSGLTVVADRPGAVDVRVVATDPLGRTVVAMTRLTGTPQPNP
jgi:hypothetical protein